MGGFSAHRLGFLAAFLLAVAAFAGGVGWFAFTSALGQLEERGRADLSLASDRLTGQLQRYRELAVLLADHPALISALEDGSGSEASALLTRKADVSGSLGVLLADERGRIVAASAGVAEGRVTGTPHFERAMTGALGVFHWVEAGSGQRVYAYAAPVFAPDGPAQGAVIVEADMAGLEWNWPADPSPVFFSDETGLVFVANRSELVLTARRDAVEGARAFPAHVSRFVDGHDLWTVDGGPYVPARALHLTLPLPVIGMTGEILLDLGTVLNLALLQAAVAAALCLAFGAMLYLATERRRDLAEKLRAEAAVTAALEARVAERTGELSEANAELVREVGERKEAEAALKRAQADLVQAGKLSALGQMSAGISHELNQPLMAIQSFAENGAVLLERGKAEAAGENLGRIGEMARRMGRIIRNLRAFARQEKAEMADVDLVAVVDAALEIARPRLTNAGVALLWPRPAGPVMVRGGEVRLQQVVLNLVSNAVDAMEGRAAPRVEVALEAGDPVVLTVRDTGPGITEPDRIFDPFYTTKEVGGSEGMGLGLSISYGLVQSFGGAIRGRNHPSGGAVFTVELSPARLERAA